MTKPTKTAQVFIRGFDAQALVSLPFYVCSAGRKRLSADSYSTSSEIRNNFVELCWSISGMGEIDFYGRKFELGPGDVFYFLPGEAHVMRGLSEEVWESRWLCFEGPLAVAVFMSYHLARVSHAAAFPEELFAEVEREIHNQSPERIARLSGLLLIALSELVTPADSGSRTLFEESMKYVQANFSDPQLSVKSLCDKFDIPQSTLTLLYRRSGLPPPGRFLAEQRLHHARSLLKGSTLPIHEVARRCGITDPSSFSRFIRAHFGKSPQDFRVETT